MYNLNVNLATTAANAVNSLLMVESACTTPRTPEILNSLIAMSNPMDNYAFCNAARESITKTSTRGTATRPQQTHHLSSSDSNSSCSSQLESPTTNNPPSVQQTCSQLIKAGLKLSIEQKRKHQPDGDDLLDLDKCSKRIKKNECSESEEDRVNKQDGMHNWTNWYETEYDDCSNSKLTPEDEERRRRRRERNKIAATKCRLKKREKTANLVNESEVLETQNVDLKTQLQELQEQKRNLVEMLTLHRPICQNNITPATRDSLYRLPPVGSIEATHSYNTSTNNRPASVDPSYRSSHHHAGHTVADSYGRPASVGGGYPPSIIIEDASGESSCYQTQLTNLDTYHYNNQCHNNYSNNMNQNYSTGGLDNGCMA